MATVYLAEDLKHRRKVALKVLRPELAATLGPERFLREIEIAAQLQHPHILPLLDSGEAEGFLYYVMPYIDGESLRDRLARQGELPIPEAVRVLAEVADALAHAHSRGVVHRDIKPDNVMLSGRHALVTDFGVAKAVSEATGRQTMTTAGVALGTPAYMAPEQATADPHVDHRADLYALGAMGYELLTGRPPFTGITPQQVLAAHVTQAADPVTAHRQSVSPVLSDVIMKCLAKRPSDRWQSAEELLAQLEPLATPSGGSTPTQTAPITGVAPVLDPWQGHPIRVGGLFLLAAVAVLGVVFFLTIQLGLPDWVLLAALGLLGIGLPIMVVTGLVERRRAAARATGLMPATVGLQGWLTWRKAITGGVLAFSVLAVGTVVYTLMRLLGLGPVGTLVAAGKLTARDKVLVADFANRTADSTLSQTVTEAFRIDLAQSPVVSVMGSAAVAEALQRMERDPTKPLDAAGTRELALRTGAKAIVEGEISPIGKGMVLTTRLVTPTDGAELVALRETADNEAGILGAIDRLSKRMRERIGESLRSIRSNEPLDQVTTGSLEALRLYTQGAHATDRGEFEQGISLLQQAVALDTGFAMAWRKLGVAFINSGADYSKTVAAYTKAFQHRDRLPEVERYLTAASYYDNVEYDLDKSIAAYRAVLQINPNQTTALNNMAGGLITRRQYAEAEQILLHAVQVDPTGVTFYNQAVQVQLLQGKSAEAAATADRLAKAVPESPFLPILQGQLATSRSAYDTAQHFLRVAAGRPEPGIQAYAFNSLASIELIQGKLASAERTYRELMAVSEKRGQAGSYVSNAALISDMGSIYRRDQSGTLKTVEAALQRYPLAKLSPLDRPYSDLAIAYALGGQAARAKQMLAEYEANVPDAIRRANPWRHYAAGLTALADARAPDAITEFRTWSDQLGLPDPATFELGLAYDAAKQPDSALAVYQRAVTVPKHLFSFYSDAYDLARSYRRLGELYEERGDRDRAAEYYGKLIELWKDADPELQPQLREVKDRLAKLVGEKKP